MILPQQERLDAPERLTPEQRASFTRRLSRLSNEIASASIFEAPKSDEVNQSNGFPKRSPTLLTFSSSINEQSFISSPTYTNLNEQAGMPDQPRPNQRRKATQLTPSGILIENFKQQYKIPGMNSSIRSNQSVGSTRRLNEPTPQGQVLRQRSSKCSCCCVCCCTPLNNWHEKKHKHQDTPNQSLTNDDDDEDKVSSNDTSNRLPLTVTSQSSLRATDPQNHTNATSSSFISSVHQCSSGTTPTSSNDVHRRERIRFLKEQKTAKTLAVVVGGFILFWLPFFIMYVIPPTIHTFDDQTAVLITWLGYFNSVINPFIYAYCSKQFRMAFWNITFGACMKKSTVPLPVSGKPSQVTRRPLNA